MRKLYSYLLAIFLTLPMLTACSEEETPDLDYYNWAQRNTEFFAETLGEAKTPVSAAKAAYGADWENHCDWRVFRSFLKSENSECATTDSICVKIVERGQGTGCPLYTDSVRVNYIGRTMPTVSYPEGRIFDHSGIYSVPEEVFHPELSHPTSLLVSNTVDGFTTVLQHMHIGDRWIVYIPAEMGYGTSDVNAIIRGSSTLIFEIQLVAYCRAGSSFYDPE
ncbi:MAG: FKBP-type peptidyl-prolyl cis-trans isomerase [Prevotellamassilia sp.]|nr:FKBP-type peptidyl-prolyl cis-trans isomerase [Prevotellamassilia sp.]